MTSPLSTLPITAAHALHHAESTVRLKPNCQPKPLHVQQNSTNCLHINLLKHSKLQARQIQTSSHAKKCTKTATTLRNGWQRHRRRLNNLHGDPGSRQIQPSRRVRGWFSLPTFSAWPWRFSKMSDALCCCGSPEAGWTDFRPIHART